MTDAFVLLPYPPSTNRYWRNFRGRMVVSAEARAYKECAALEAEALGMKMLDCPVAVELELHPRLNKNGKASGTRIDLDNCIKVVLDAGNGVMWADDSQIVRLSAQISEPLPEGGVSMRVRAA